MLFCSHPGCYTYRVTLNFTTGWTPSKRRLGVRRSGRTIPCQCPEGVWGSNRKSLLIHSSLQIDHRIRNKYNFFTSWNVSYLWHELQNWNARYIATHVENIQIWNFMHYYWSIWSKKSETMVILGEPPKIVLQFKKLEEKLKRNNMQYISLFDQF